MEDRSFEELIEELRAITIRENEIITELEQANRARVNTNNATNDRGADHSPSVNGFRRGDRVRIINKVRKPATSGSMTWWTAAKERLATVTRVIPVQVHILTDNGTKTWRAPNKPTDPYTTLLDMSSTASAAGDTTTSGLTMKLGAATLLPYKDATEAVGAAKTGAECADKAAVPYPTDP